MKTGLGRLRDKVALVFGAGSSGQGRGGDPAGGRRLWSNGEAASVLYARDARSPTGRMGDAWDVARAALFLASDEAKYVNGVCLAVDGGLTCL